MLYLSTPSNRVIALDAETGREIWQFDPQAGRAKRKFFQHRGVAYWQSKTGDDRRILYGTFDGRMICFDAKNGKTCRGFGTNGVVNLRAGVADEFPDCRVRCDVTARDLQRPGDYGRCGSGIPIQGTKRGGTRV